MPACLVKPRVLLFGSISHLEASTVLQEIADITIIPRRPYEETVQNIARAVEEHGPFVAFGFTSIGSELFPFKWNRQLLAPLHPACKLYARIAAGYDMVDVDYITSCGAYFANAPYAISYATAQGALALLLQATRGLGPQEKSLRAGQWALRNIRTLDWSTMTVGLIGLGRIGSYLARMLAALDIKIIYSTRNPRPDQPFERVVMDELFARSDVVVLCCPLSDQTRGLVNKGSIAKMKDGVIVVNVSRGGVVVDEDLVTALGSGKVSRVALDVFPNEPIVHPGLIANANATLTPHICAGLDIAGPKAASEVVENISKFIQSGKPNTPVNVSELAERGFYKEGRLVGCESW